MQYQSLFQEKNNTMKKENDQGNLRNDNMGTSRKLFMESGKMDDEEKGRKVIKDQQSK